MRRSVGGPGFRGFWIEQITEVFVFLLLKHDGETIVPRQFSGCGLGLARGHGNLLRLMAVLTWSQDSAV